MLHRSGPGVLPSPNIWHWPDVYETENRAQDDGGAIWRLLAERVDWAGRDVVDVGCGDGFHLPVFAATARQVTGVEPHRPLLRRAARRLEGMGPAGPGNVRLMAGSAQRLPLPDGCADLVHARTAYFFGRGCEPGLVEADRVLRPGGALAIVDLDGAASPYGDWMRADLPRYDPADVLGFFAGQAFECHFVTARWRFADRASVAAALRIEFSPAVAERALTEITGTTIPVGYRVHIRRKPAGLIC